ncbi:hypothetical protein [Paracoccus sp. (in: a-proteobacteria)]|uniref:hypothetical protein n=1 Tax=Paracoccus sp. TaxID=267 RepID=UPI0028A23351|nr:hypothetical protein [Paracoccus sp. (in: a-proteobacteria)]
MAEDWIQIAAEVTGALGDVGHRATLLRPGSPVGPSHDQRPGSVVRIPVKLMGDSISLGMVDGTRIQMTDRREIMAAEGVVPAVGEHVEIGATVYEIRRAEPYAPGGEALYFDLILRA